GQGTRCITYTAGAGGTVHLTIHVAKGNCTCDSTKDLTIKPNPDCTITGAPPCANSTGNPACVPDAGAGAGDARAITGGTVTAGQGTHCITYTAGASGTVHLTIHVDLNGCSCDGSRDLIIHPNPDCTITAAPPCANSTGNMACVPDAGAG